MPIFKTGISAGAISGLFLGSALSAVLTPLIIKAEKLSGELTGVTVERIAGNFIGGILIGIAYGIFAALLAAAANKFISSNIFRAVFIFVTGVVLVVILFNGLLSPTLPNSGQVAVSNPGLLFKFKLFSYAVTVIFWGLTSILSVIFYERFSGAGRQS